MGWKKRARTQTHKEPTCQEKASRIGSSTTPSANKEKANPAQQESVTPPARKRGVSGKVKDFFGIIDDEDGVV
jgi:hypothetical protein